MHIQLGDYLDIYQTEHNKIPLIFFIITCGHSKFKDTLDIEYKAFADTSGNTNASQADDSMSESTDHDVQTDQPSSSNLLDIPDIPTPKKSKPIPINLEV